MFLINRLKPELYRNMHIGNNLGGEINASYPSSLGITGLGVELRKEFLVSNNLGNRNRWVTQVFWSTFSLFSTKITSISRNFVGKLFQCRQFLLSGIRCRGRRCRKSQNLRKYCQSSSSSQLYRLVLQRSKQRRKSLPKARKCYFV